MDFIKRARRKLIRYNVVWLLCCLVGLCSVIIPVFLDGFWEDSTASVVCWLVWALVLGSIAIAVIIYLIKRLVSRNRSLMEIFARLGNPDAIGREIAGIPRYYGTNGGELRFNTRILYYQKGSDCNVVLMEEIESVEAVEDQSGEDPDYFVRVGLTNGQTFDIHCKGTRELRLLARDIRTGGRTYYAFQ